MPTGTPWQRLGRQVVPRRGGWNLAAPGHGLTFKPGDAEPYRVA
jgi:hypothetical protein